MYKAITYLVKLCGRLAGAAKSHGELVADALAAAHRGRFRGTFPDALELHHIIREELVALQRQIVEVETALMKSLTADQLGRALRNRSFAVLREQLLAIRKILDALFGPGAADIVFVQINSVVATDPVTVYRQAILVHDNLLYPSFELPELRFDIGADLQQLARDMEPHITELGEVLERLNDQLTQQSVAEKETLLAETKLRAGLGARLLEALAAYAGKPGIARRIRLSSHVSSAQAPEEAAAAGEPVPQDPAAPAPAEEVAAVRTAPASAEPSPAEPPTPAPAPAGEAPDTPGGAAAPPASEG